MIDAARPPALDARGRPGHDLGRARHARTRRDHLITEPPERGALDRGTSPGRRARVRRLGTRTQTPTSRHRREAGAAGAGTRAASRHTARSIGAARRPQPGQCVGNTASTTSSSRARGDRTRADPTADAATLRRRDSLDSRRLRPRATWARRASGGRAGGATPTSVMIAVTRCAGVTSNAGFHTATCRRRDCDAIRCA